MAALPKDVMAYLAPASASVYEHLSQVLAKVTVTGSKDPAANFDKISRSVLEDTFVWPVEVQPMKVDLTAQQASRDLFMVAKAVPHIETGIVGAGNAFADTYVPDIMAEAEMLQWSGCSLGEVEMCKVMLAVRKLAGDHPELKSVRFFGKFLGTGDDYLVCEGELTAPDEAPPANLAPNHPGRRNIEKVVHHNMLKYYVCPFPGAPWVTLPNLRLDQLLAVRAVKKLFTGNLAAPIRSFPPFPGETEAHYLRAKIAYIGVNTCMAPAG
ncbi:radial spokehead-like protein [Baffinella frigidus]|nr:radial spokehead-like protein [Cryptophyta sp. CCMP2293]